MNISTFTDDCLLAIFSELPLDYRLSTVPLVCRRWALLQPLVRREVTSVTLLSGDSSNADYYQLKSPFHLVDKRTVITESPDLLQLSSFPDTADDVVERLQTELPNIRRLTIVQVNQKPSALQPELLSAVEAYAGQLTSFAFYFQFKSFCSELAFDVAEKQPALAANFHRLLSLINYGMPLLRHLLLNYDQSFFYNDHFQAISLMPEKTHKNNAPGSLYLPVLRRLHTFSFKSPYHADILHYSLGKFAPGNDRLKLRLVHVPLSPLYDKFTPEKLWKEEVVISHLDYLSANNSTLCDMPKLCLLANIKYLHLDDYPPYYDSYCLLPLFTAFSTNFPKLTILSLYMSWSYSLDLVPADLPPLPQVTSLVVNWKFDNTDNFGAIFQPTRVFPALRWLTIDPYPCCDPILSSNLAYDFNHEVDLSTIQQTLQSLKLYPPGALQHISINFCKLFCQSKRLALTVKDL